MVEAAIKPITWALLSTVWDRLVAHWQSASIAEHLFFQGLEAGIRWQGVVVGVVPACDRDMLANWDAAFWTGCRAVGSAMWQESWARPYSRAEYVVTRIVVALDEVVSAGLLPPVPVVDAPTPLPSRVRSNVDWMRVEIAQMKAAGEISADIKKTPLARKLVPRLRKAAADNPALHPLSERTIVNNLEKTWLLFPI